MKACGDQLEKEIHDLTLCKLLILPNKYVDAAVTIMVISTNVDPKNHRSAVPDAINSEL